MRMILRDVKNEMYDNIEMWEIMVKIFKAVANN